MKMFPLLTELGRLYSKYNMSPEHILKTIDWLRHYGYLAKEGELTLSDVIEALTRVQKLIGTLKVDGELGPKTFTALMTTPRCAHVEQHEEFDIEKVWGTKHLTYYVEQRDTDLTIFRWDTILGQAFGAWASISGLTFEQVDTKSSAKLVMSIGAGQQFGFDGPGKTLAWAQLPPGSRFNGQLLCRFDADETWTELGSGRGIHLLNVATHEIGHLIGLRHSEVSSALMAPFYSATLSEPQQNDDVSRIQNLYGPGSGTPNPTPTPIPTEIPAPTNLTLSIDDRSRVVLKWKDNSRGEDGFEIWRNDVKYGEMKRGQTEAIDTGVVKGGFYRYVVRARMGSKYSKFSTASRIMVPNDNPTPVPTDLETLVIRVTGRDLQIETDS